MSDWVPEAQRIAKEAAEKAQAEVIGHANVAMGWLIQNAPAAAQHVLEAVVLRRPIPPPAEQTAFARGDWKRNEAVANAMALNARLTEARDAALEEAAKVAETPDERGAGFNDHIARRIRALKGRTS